MKGKEKYRFLIPWEENTRLKIELTLGPYYLSLITKPDLIIPKQL